MRLSRYFHYDSFKITTFCFLKRDDERRISRYCPHSLPSLKVVFSNFITLKKIPELSGPPQWLSGKETTCGTGDTGDVGSIPGSGRPPGGGHGNPLQYSRLENPHGQRSLVATVHGVAKSWTRLKQHSTIKESNRNYKSQEK